MNANVLCVACQRGDTPGGAHRCIKCTKAVHPFEGCSESCGEEEGFGENRICVACIAGANGAAAEQSSPMNYKGGSNSIAKQLNQTEKWNRKTRSSSSYLAPVKNWSIDKKVQAKPKISMLINANLSTTIHIIDKQKTGLRNTCGPDCVLQVN